jgi:hypothetical protein
MLRDGWIDVAAFWRHVGNPVLSDDSGDTWFLSTGAAER